MQQFSNSAIDFSHFEYLYPDTSRFNEIEKLLSFIKSGNSCQVVGLAGVGGANLLGLLSYNKKVRAKHLGENSKWFHFVPVDLSEIRKKPLTDAWKFIFLNLSASLKERKDTPLGREGANGKEFANTVDKIFKASAGNDELVLFQGLKSAIDFLCIEKELTIVFLFDGFEKYLRMIDESFFGNLRILRNRAKYRFSAVFALRRPLEELIEPSLLSDFYEFLAGNIVYLPIMDEPGLSFRISYLEKAMGKTIDKRIKNQILDLTGGHGKLTRIALEVVIAKNYEAGIRSQALAEFLLQQKTIQGALYELWQSLTPFEQKSLVSNQLVGSGYLADVGLVKDGKITIPLLGDFSLTLLGQAYGKARQLSYDETTGEIKRGEEVISDRLSASEFRLLKFLIENSGRVCGKEEIINAVWKDTKTHEGVTDQALDQIIYRLRKKIEDNPNSPRYIQTVKGRGLRFSN